MGRWAARDAARGWWRKRADFCLGRASAVMPGRRLLPSNSVDRYGINDDSWALDPGVHIVGGDREPQFLGEGLDLV